MANKVYIKDKDGNDLLAATDWSIINGKPNNLATTNQLPTITGQQRDGIQFVNGAYDWDHVNNGWNCCYRIADLGGFKLVELRLMFALNKDVTGGLAHAIKLPNIINPDQNIETWYSTNVEGTYVHHSGTDVDIEVHSGKYPANTLVSYYNHYLTTN